MKHFPRYNINNLCLYFISKYIRFTIVTGQCLVQHQNFNGIFGVKCILFENENKLKTLLKTIEQ